MNESSMNIANYYNLCCRVLQPFINICNGMDQPLKICNETNWNDECDDTRHLTKWIIRDEQGNEIWRQASFVNMEGSVPIGMGSTGAALNLPNGVEDLISFMESIGVCVCMGQVFQLCIVARNCYNSSKESNILTFRSCRSSNSITINNIPLLLNGTPLVSNPKPLTRITDCEYTDPTGETHIIKGLQSYNSETGKATIILSNESTIVICHSDFESQFGDFQNFINHLQQCDCGCGNEGIVERGFNTGGIEEYFEIIKEGDQEREISPLTNYDSLRISNKSELPIIVTIFHGGRQSRIRVGENQGKTFDWEESIIEKIRFGEINQGNVSGAVSGMDTQTAYEEHEIELTFFNSK